MSSPSATAARWFVPDSEWAALMTDYAVVHKRAVAIREAMQEYNRFPHSRAIGTYLDLLDRIEDQPSPYYIISESQLLYADVNQHDPKHKRQVLAWAKEPLLETEATETIKAAHALNTTRGLPDHIKFNLDPSWARVPPPFVKYILSSPDRTHRRECLRVLSHQARVRSPRPVLSFVTMVDSMLATEPGTTKGWVCAYDFVDNELIIKPFVSKKDQHPLGDPWSTAPVNDGVSFRGSPAGFVKRFLEMSSDSPGGDNWGFAMVVYLRVVHWIQRHWAALEVASAGGTDPLDEKKQCQSIDAVGQAADALARLKFPVSASAGTTRDAHHDEGELLPCDGFDYLQGYLEAGEGRFRRDALRGREVGKEGVSERIAAFYASLLEQLKKFNADPQNWLPRLDYDGDEEEGVERSLCGSYLYAGRERSPCCSDHWRTWGGSERSDAEAS
ncbi:MAG: hypothetical protein LQ347_001872 [Umbilicaria vellea]|nr:MAG: hypothetical protein LQ347_001872 [Umbilicaria vellea]